MRPSGEFFILCVLGFRFNSICTLDDIPSLLMRRACAEGGNETRLLLYRVEADHVIVRRDFLSRRGKRTKNGAVFDGQIEARFALRKGCAEGNRPTYRLSMRLSLADGHAAEALKTAEHALDLVCNRVAIIGVRGRLPRPADPSRRRVASQARSVSSLWERQRMGQRLGASEVKSIPDDHYKGDDPAIIVTWIFVVRRQCGSWRQKRATEPSQVSILADWKESDSTSKEKTRVNGGGR